MSNRRRGDRGGIFASLGRALDESVEMAMAVRSGRMSRADFDRWWNRRREQSRDVMEAFRDQTSALVEPVGSAFEMSRGVLRSAATGGSRRGSRRRSSSSRRRSSAVNSRARTVRRASSRRRSRVRA